MARLSLATRKSIRRKKLIATSLKWLEILNIIYRFYQLLCNIATCYVEILYLKDSYTNDFYLRRRLLNDFVYRDDEVCVSQIRMNRSAFRKLCYMLEHEGGLKDTKYMMVDEQVAICLHILAHHVKNRVIQSRFRRSGETISRHFGYVLKAIMRLQSVFLKKPEPVAANSSDFRWKWFKNCLGALDGTYIRLHVSAIDRPRYRNRKGEIATNMLGVCSQDMQLIYVLTGWEGSAADGRVLRDAINRKNGLKVPRGYYYLVDAGYTNCEGFLAPYRGQRYHLNDWKEGHQPTNPKEFFNMKHSSARNVIERCFGVLKLRWAILRSPAFYPVKTCNMIIMACCLLHNFIRREMTVDLMEERFDRRRQQVINETESQEVISAIETSNEWSIWRDQLANEMFNEWQNRN